MSINTPIDPLGLYAAAIDTSDYVPAVTPVVRMLAPEYAGLLDIGAGGGQLGAALVGEDGAWSAIEPSALMRRRLERLRPRPTIHPCGWEEARLEDAAHDLVLAATMPALFERPAEFLARCRTWARRAVIWVVPAHHGPKGLILAGCLPHEWHREDETPGLDITLGRLSAVDRPERIEFAPWTFSAVVRSLPQTAAFLADRLNSRGVEIRRDEIENHLRRQAKPDPMGWRLEIPRNSAILKWSV